MNLERQRLADNGPAWKRWGPYLSERQWGTVREDYSPHGTAWGWVTHDMARSKAFRWGEEGIAGIADDHQRLCLALALWNGRDPILKERLFGLSGPEGNHGEDVKELYFFLDATPTHSYLKMAYDYPQAEFPYARLVEENRRRGRHEPEYELADTGVFAEDRFFDVEVELAKADPEDLLYRVTVNYIGREAAADEVVAQIQGGGGRAIAVQADVSDEGQVEAMFGRVVSELGTIDILVNNAGIQQDAPFHEMSLASDWADYINGVTIVVDSGMTLYPAFAHGG